MKGNKIIFWAFTFLLIIAGIFVFRKGKSREDIVIAYSIDPRKQDLKLYRKDDKNENFRSIQNLKLWLHKRKREIVLAMNAGMYKQDNSPQGLFIENNRTLSPLDTSDGQGNFYLKPNGVFYVTDDQVPVICKTSNFIDNRNIKYATQSGPMLVIDGQINSAFKEGSVNLNVRNGVGILPGNKVVFAMSKKEISFYNFAQYFKSIGCNNALYLDGLVSRTYLPEKKWVQTDGNFGVIIGVTTELK